MTKICSYQIRSDQIDRQSQTRLGSRLSIHKHQLKNPGTTKLPIH